MRTRLALSLVFSGLLLTRVASADDANLASGEPPSAEEIARAVRAERSHRMNKLGVYSVAAAGAGVSGLQTAVTWATTQDVPMTAGTAALYALVFGAFGGPAVVSASKRYGAAVSRAVLERAAQFNRLGTRGSGPARIGTSKPEFMEGQTGVVTKRGLAWMPMTGKMAGHMDVDWEVKAHDGETPVTALGVSHLRGRTIKSRYFAASGSVVRDGSSTQSKKGIVSSDGAYDMLSRNMSRTEASTVNGVRSVATVKVNMNSGEVHPPSGRR